jgi:hypothetical protein
VVRRPRALLDPEHRPHRRDLERRRSGVIRGWH